MIRAIIIDDEKLSVISLQNKLNAFSEICIVQTYTNLENLITDLKQEKIDVVFLDIEMGELNGIDLAETILSIQSTIHIVFVTAHSEYAVKAFEIDSIDYLLKPVTTKRLQKTMNRLKKKLEDSKMIQAQESARISLKIRCFHELQVFQNDCPIHFKTAKVKELFGFLLTYLNQPINRDLLIERLWPDQDYKKSKIHLHTCLSHLRKTLNELGYPNSITFSNQCYSMKLDHIDCDALEVEKAVQQIESGNEITITDIENVIQFYTGSYMELNGYEWIYEKSRELDEKIFVLLSRVIEYYQTFDGGKALHYLQLKLKINPYHDETLKQYMQLLTKLGSRSEAIMLYQEYKERLAEELGIEPDRSLNQFYESLFYN